MTKPWIFVSPASRGIGLHLAKRLLKTTDLPVVATARTNLDKTKTEILSDIDADSEERLTVLPLDVTKEETISSAASTCKTLFPDQPLRLAFLVPGILHPEKSPAQISASDALITFQINTLGPLLLTKHFINFLPRKSQAPYPSPSSSPAINSTLPDPAVLALMSARVGSISDNALGGWYSYRASKAGVNQIAKSVDIYMKQRSGDNAMCVSLHPGTVKTGLSEAFWNSTPAEKLFSPEYAAERLIEVVSKVGIQGRGKCWDWKGEEVPP